MRAQLEKTTFWCNDDYGKSLHVVVYWSGGKGLQDRTRTLVVLVYDNNLGPNCAKLRAAWASYRLASVGYGYPLFLSSG